MNAINFMAGYTENKIIHYFKHCHGCFVRIFVCCAVNAAVTQISRHQAPCLVCHFTCHTQCISVKPFKIILSTNGSKFFSVPIILKYDAWIYRKKRKKKSASFVDPFCYLCFVSDMLSCLFIEALWSPIGKRLTSWLSCM